MGLAVAVEVISVLADMVRKDRFTIVMLVMVMVVVEVAVPTGTRQNIIPPRSPASTTHTIGMNTTMAGTGETTPPTLTDSPRQCQ